MTQRRSLAHLAGEDAPRLLGKALSWDWGVSSQVGQGNGRARPGLDLPTPLAEPLSQALTFHTKRGIPLAPNVQPAPKCWWAAGDPSFWLWVPLWPTARAGQCVQEKTRPKVRGRRPASSEPIPTRHPVSKALGILQKPQQQTVTPKETVSHSPHLRP